MNPSFKRDVFSLFSGALGVQVIGLAFMPFLTRLYGPEDFGVAAVYTSIVGVIGVISCLRYEVAIVLPQKDDEAFNLLILSTLVLLMFTTGLVVVLKVFSSSVFERTGYTNLAQYVWLIPIGVFISGLYNILNFWNTRNKNFRKLSVAQVSGSFVNNIGRLTSGLIGQISAGALIYNLILSQIISTCILFYNRPILSARLLIQKISLAKLFQQARAYSNFPLVNLWSALLNQFSVQMPIIVLSLSFDSYAVGQYSLAHRALSLPVTLAGASIAQVFYQRASGFNELELKTLVEETIVSLIKIGFFPFFSLLFLGPVLFTTVFGIEWLMAGNFSRILALWLIAVFIISPIASLAMVLNKQKEFLLFNILLVLFRIVALSIGGIFDNIKLSIIMYSVVGCFFWLVLGYYLLRLVTIDLRNLFCNACISISKAIAFASPLLLLTFAVPSNEVVILSGAALASMAYYYFVFLFRT